MAVTPKAKLGLAVLAIGTLLAAGVNAQSLQGFAAQASAFGQATADTLYCKLAGCTMAGAIDMGSNNFTTTGVINGGPLSTISGAAASNGNIDFQISNTSVSGHQCLSLFGTGGTSRLCYGNPSSAFANALVAYLPTGVSFQTWPNGAVEFTSAATGNTFIHKITAPLVNTTTNCASSGGTCAAAAAGAVTIAAVATTVTVATTAVTSTSRIFVQENSTRGTELSVTCNTTLGRSYAVTTQTAGVSFVITTSAAPVTNPACLTYFIVN